MVYPPKREWCWQTICPLLLIVGWAATMMMGGPPDGTGGFLAFIRILCWSIVGATSVVRFRETMNGLVYEITDTELIVHFGPQTRPIPLDAIYAVEKCHGELGSHSTAREALRIRFHTNRVVGDYVVVSPLDRMAFLADLQQRATNLRSMPHTAMTADARLAATGS